MQNGAHITARQRAVLNATAQLYIDSGEPVSSQSVMQVLSLQGMTVSSATVRNTMAELADGGLLEQPHTSAGRVPSARGFRVYVESLTAGERIGPALLQPASRTEIDARLHGASGTQDFLERTSHVLASVSSGVGLAVASVSGSDLLEHIHFSQLASHTVLAVVVMRSGLVRDRVLTLQRELSGLELETASRFLNENFRGWSVERVRAELNARIESERSEYQRMLAAVEELWAQSVPSEQTVYVEGVLNLVTARVVVGTDERLRLRAMLGALEEKERLITLLNAYVDARQESVRVVFDLDEHAPAMEGLVLIAAPAVVNGETRGALGVIGPKRMDYEATMNAVGYVAQLFDRMLQRPDRTAL